ncbi:MAG: hypothetical protein ACTSQ8_26965 [Candidatus Helarchaeota archaeon]
MSKSLRIYVAGPYSPKSDNKHTCIQEVAHNVDRAVRIGLILISKGHYPFIPHLTHYIHTNPFCKTDLGSWYYEYDLTFLYHWAEALYYIAPSKGADRELEIAKKLGLKIFYSLDEVPEVDLVE